MGIIKTVEKIKKDSIGITKTHGKIIKFKKYVKKSKNNIKIKTNQKNTISAKTQKHFKRNTKKRNKSKAKSDKVLKFNLSEPNINMTQPVITNIDYSVLPSLNLKLPFSSLIRPWNPLPLHLAQNWQTRRNQLENIL